MSNFSGHFPVFIFCEGDTEVKIETITYIKALTLIMKNMRSHGR